MRYFAGMYFKISIRHNPAIGFIAGYYRLVESYRNSNDRVCHRTILNIGFLEGVSPKQLNQIQKILTAKVENLHSGVLFDLPEADDPVVARYVDELYKRLVDEKRIDLPSEKRSTRNKSGQDIQQIDINSIRNKDVREIGSEWMAYQAISQLRLAELLKNKGWQEQDIQLALTHIISRAVYPASELETARWIRENSAVCEITGYEAESINKDKLYKISHRLYSEREAIGEHLSRRTNELFDIQDRIMIFDLTNTYFEGEKRASDLAKHGRSKEKRSDARLVVLALVVNPEGFIKYFNVHQGNMSDPSTLEHMLKTLRAKTSSTATRALVVIDAGIATEANLAKIKEQGYDYLCVTRSALKQYSVEPGSVSVEVKDNKMRTITLSRVQTERDTDYYLKIESNSKAKKECSMNQLFRDRFEQGLQRISDSLSKKGGVKQLNKVYERIGRLKQKYPSIHKYYDIQVEEADVNPSSKKPDACKIAASMKWEIKPDEAMDARSGIYFLRTSVNAEDEQTLWLCYNIIREIEATFRTLKTDLDLRPIYHQKDDSTMAHLHLGILAYWVVNTIRFQLKKNNINNQWRELVRIMNTQKAVTTLAQNVSEQVIKIRRCTDPIPKARQIYDTLKFKYAPFVRKKSVVHKSELDDCQLIEQQLFRSD
jgi:transposase